MDLNKLTQKSRDAVAGAQSLAVRLGHQEVDTEHLLAALLAQPDGLAPRLLQRLEAAPAKVAAEVEEELRRRPSVSGGGTEAGKIYVTQRLQQALVRAQDEAKRLRDEYVSVEHLLLALTAPGSMDSGPAAGTLKRHGVTHDALLESLRAV